MSRSQESAFNCADDPILRAIVGRLITELKCHTVILYGSRARGDATDQSDYDLVGFAKGGEEISDIRIFEGKYVDAYVYPEKRALADTEEFLRLQGGIVLYEENDFGMTLMRRVDALYRTGPKALLPEEAIRRRLWIEKMLARIEKDDVEARYRRVWLLTELLELYFLFRGQWYRGPKESLQWLRANDLSGFTLFDSALQPNAKPSDLRDLAAKVMQPNPRQQGLRSE